VATRLLLAEVGRLAKPSAAQPVQASPLPVHDGDERTVAAAHDRSQRCEVEVALDADPVGNRLRELEIDPHPVESGAEDREPTRTVALELVLEVALEPLEIALERLLLLVALVAPKRVLVPVGEQGIHARRCVARCRRPGGIEIDVQADGATLLRAVLGQLADVIPCRGRGHWHLLGGCGRF